jgi:hypothetical protein
MWWRCRFESEDVCLQCFEGGKLICCDFCPMVYHEKCLGITAKDMPKLTWSRLPTHEPNHEPTHEPTRAHELTPTPTPTPTPTGTLMRWSIPVRRRMVLWRDLE